MKDAKKFSRENAVEVARRQRQILDAIAYLEQINESFDADWRGKILVHKAFPGAASAYNVVPGENLLITDIGDEEPALVNIVHIERVELLETAPGVVEPIITDSDDVQHTQPSLGLTADYDTGEWGRFVPISDSVLSLTLAMQWFLYEYGEKAVGIASELAEYLATKHGIMVMTTADLQVEQEEISRPYSC